MHNAHRTLSYLIAWAVFSRLLCSHQNIWIFITFNGEKSLSLHWISQLNHLNWKKNTTSMTYGLIEQMLWAQMLLNDIQKICLNERKGWKINKVQHFVHNAPKIHRNISTLLCPQKELSCSRWTCKCHKIKQNNKHISLWSCQQIFLLSFTYNLRHLHAMQ